MAGVPILSQTAAFVRAMSSLVRAMSSLVPGEKMQVRNIAVEHLLSGIH